LANIKDTSEKGEAFKNKPFTYRLVELIKKYGNDENCNSLITLGKGMPSSLTDKDAFIVKYSRFDPMGIITRFLQSSLVSVEHIRPKSQNGGNNIYNLLYICTKCNNERKDISLDEFVEDNPNIEASLRKHFGALLNEFSDNSSMIKNYISEVKTTLRCQSGGKLRLW